MKRTLAWMQGSGIIAWLCPARFAPTLTLQE
jgi:hypothetical protein